MGTSVVPNVRDSGCFGSLRHDALHLVIVSGGLPEGLSLSTNGVISGTPSMATNASFTVQVMGNDGLAATNVISLTITGPPTILTTSPLPSGAAGVAYNQTLAASGGTTPYTWSIISGGLPEGLSLSTNA